MKLSIVNLSDTIPLSRYTKVLYNKGVIKKDEVITKYLSSGGLSWNLIMLECDNEFPIKVINTLKKYFNINHYILDLTDDDECLFIDDFDENRIAIDLQDYINQKER